MKSCYLFIIFSIIFATFPMFASYSIDPELAIGMWLFDEGSGKNAIDSSGQGNDGKIVGAEYVDGKFIKALYFDGDSNYIEVQDADSLNPTDKLSIVMWVKPDAGLNCDANNNWRYLVHKGSYHLIWESDWGNNEVAWTLSIGGGSKRLWNKSGARPEIWTHLGFTYDSEAGSKVYVNGIQEIGGNAEGPINGNIDINTMILKIGGGANKGCPNGSGYFGGIIDEVGMFDEELTKDDITDIMNDGLEKSVRPFAVGYAGKIATTWGNMKEQ